MGVKRADKRRLDELRVEVGVKESVTKKLVRNRLKWVMTVTMSNPDDRESKRICQLPLFTFD